MRSPKAAHVAVALAFVSVVGCKGGGSGDDPNAPLSGTLRVAEFVVPAGVVRKVVDDLKIFATGKIQIDGELRVSPAANFALIARGPLIINGRLLGEDGALPDGGAPSGKPREKSATRTVTRALEEGPPIVLAGSSVTVGATSAIFAVGGERSVSLVTTDPFVRLGDDGTIRVAGFAIARSGSRAFSSSEQGHEGGSVEIGTAKASEGATAQGVEDIVTPEHVVISGRLHAGDGGDGYNDRDGRIVERALHLTGTNGGAGGSVSVKATSAIDVTGADIKGGYGGEGGEVGRPIGEAPTVAPNGQAEGETGYAVVAVTGSGGGGGSVRFDAPRVVGLAGKPGSGGGAGDVALSSGHGGPGGNGGGATLTLGAKGDNGTGPLEQTFSPRSATVVVGGGHGGDSPRSSLPGGHGGILRISGAGGSTVTVDQILPRNFGNGGKGFNGCATLPTTAGTNGGKGGDLNANVIGPIRDQDSFVGGAGGNGNPPGEGGFRGQDLVNQRAIGRNGLTGNACPSGDVASLTVTRVGTGTGTITSQPAGVSCGETCTATFVRGTQVTLSATNDGGAAVVSWGGDCASAGSSQTCTLTMDGDKSVTATLSDGYEVTVRRAGTGTGRVEGTGGISCGATCRGFVAHGGSVTLTATADPGSTFAGWSDDCGGTGICTRLNIITPLNITATFNLLPADAGLPPDAGLSTTALWAQFRVSETTTLIRNGAGFAPAQAPLPQAELRPPTQATVRHLGPVVISIITPGAPPVPAPATITATTPINSMTATYSGTTGRYTDSFANPSGPFFDDGGAVSWAATGQPGLTTSAPPAAAGSTFATPAGAATDANIPMPMGPVPAGFVVTVNGVTADGRTYSLEGRYAEPTALPDGGFGASAPVNALIDSAVAALAPDGGRDFFLADPKNIFLSVDVGNIAQAPWSVFDDAARVSSTRRTQISGAELGIGCPFGEARCGTTGVCTDLSLSIDHCGRCGNVCLSALRGAPVCEGYRCALDCEAGYGDCDGNVVTGCERRLNVPEHCGACNRLPTEVCDGLDNTCNNQVDEGCPRRIIIPSETIVNSPVWGNTQPPGALSSLQADCGGGPNLNVMIGICGSYTTHVRQLGAYCGTHSLVSQTSTVPYTYAFTRGATGGCNRTGSPAANATQFDFVCPANMFVRRIFGEAGDDLGKVGVECVQLEVVPGTGNTWTLAEGATTTSEAYGSGMGTPFSWPSATTPGGALRALYGTYGIQNPVWVISTIGVTFRLDLYP